MGDTDKVAEVAKVLLEEIPNFSPDTSDLPFAEFDIDSFGLLTLRTRLEYILGRDISDADWTSLSTPVQLQSLVVDMLRENVEVAGLAAAPGTARRVYNLNMLQMAMSGLSEPWCLKEFGDLHWAMIANGLRVTSSDLVDGTRERLYATFTRLRYESSHPLSAFTENEDVVLEGEISRFGAGIFFSDITLSGSGKSIKATAMSSFTKRAAPGSNIDLLKGQPKIPDDCPIPILDGMPSFGLEYRLLREVAFTESLFECGYEVIPYHDINGVGLLYFAAYPTISDICELHYMNVGNRWAARARTVSRDVYYFANSDMDDQLIYQVHARRDVNSGIKIESSISRAGDGKPMAYIVTRKDVTDM